MREVISLTLVAGMWAGVAAAAVPGPDRPLTDPK